MIYPIVIHKEHNSDFGVIVPDLPGCFSAGSTPDEAIQNAKEAILLHIEGMIEDHEKIPESSGVEIIQKSHQDGIIALVSIDLSELYGKRKRINVSVPSRVLNKVDSFVDKQGETRSGVIVNALLEYIHHHETMRK